MDTNTRVFHPTPAGARRDQRACNSSGGPSVPGKGGEYETPEQGGRRTHPRAYTHAMNPR
jgi:hypothetical protein